MFVSNKQQHKVMKTNQDCRMGQFWREELMTFDHMCQVVYLLGRLGDNQSNRSKCIQQCSIDAWWSDENPFVWVVCEYCGRSSNRPDRDVVVDNPSESFLWNRPPIGTTTCHVVCGWPCREWVGVELGKVKQQFRPGYRDYGVK
jgi:hypothetical protein